ncbi:MAG: Crp/Fnr family transcriptional regulator [Coriobacteriales bacterium]|jgi:CRP-like cAMP-binding protein|nr:Crp/Fnr family transcriptional regulator [Coriobacteriales bacterium]
MNLEALGTCTLFTSIKEDELSAILTCLGAKTKHYTKGQFIFKTGTKLTRVGVVLEGCVHLIQEDYWGNRLLIEQVTPGEIFGEAFACSLNEVLLLDAQAAKDSTVLFLDFQRLVTTCSSACAFHLKLITNMVSSMARENIALTRKIEHTNRRSISDKILSYLSTQALLHDSSHFEVPFSRQEFADYLAIDRASLCRSLAALKEQGVIDVQGRSISLLTSADV